MADVVTPKTPWARPGAVLDPPDAPNPCGGERSDTFMESLTLVFTDLQDSTHLKQKLGDPAARALIDRHRRLVQQLIDEEPAGQGRVVNCAGDGFFLAFRTPSAAARFALRLQGAHAEERRLPPVRIGIHQGEVEVKEGPSGFDGVEVDTAARLVGLARPGQVLMSIGALRSAKAHLRADGVGRPVIWRIYGDYRVKGLEEPILVGEAGVDGLSPLTAPARQGASAAGPDGDGKAASGRRLRRAGAVAVLVACIGVPLGLLARGVRLDPAASSGTVYRAAPGGFAGAKAAVFIRPAWGRAGHPGKTFLRPSRPGSEDWLNVNLGADRPGLFYVFQIRPDGTAEFQPPDYDDLSGTCSGLDYSAEGELLFGTYQLSDTPGPYCFVAVLVSEPQEDLCRVVEPRLTWPPAGATMDAAVARALEGLGSEGTILGYAHVNYTVAEP